MAPRLPNDLEKHKKDEILIEEQDGTWYLVHLDPWISIDESSPLYPNLRQCHAQWLQSQLTDRDE